MRVLLLADIHGNWQALQAVVERESFDLMLVAGDLVDFGPEPHKVLDYLRGVHHLAVAGNHDTAVAENVHPGSTTPLWRSICEKSAEHSRRLIGPWGLRMLRRLPPERLVQAGGTDFYITHGAPGDATRYVEPDTPEDSLRALFGGIEAQLILLGHTHLPMLRSVEGRVLLNPGSVGQPKNGSPHAHYAVFHGLKLELRHVAYDIEKTIKDYAGWPFTAPELDALADALRTGGGSRPVRPAGKS